MARSVWKGPFVHPSLLKKIDKIKEGGEKDQLKLGQEILLLSLIL
jgi:ribosomal protein S19